MRRIVSTKTVQTVVHKKDGSSQVKEETIVTTKYEPVLALVSSGDQTVDQMKHVSSLIQKTGLIPSDHVEAEVVWFYKHLGLEDLYFKLETPENISQLILALFAAKIDAFIKNESVLDINLVRETENGAIYIQSAAPGASSRLGYERIIDEKYLNAKDKEAVYRLESYRSSSTAAFSTNLMSYFVRKCTFPKSSESNEFLMKSISDPDFIVHCTPATYTSYERVIKQVLVRAGIVIECQHVPNSIEKRLIIGYKQGTTENYFSALTDLYQYYGLYSTKKFVESFANGVVVLSVYLKRLEKKGVPPMEESIVQVMKEASLLYCLPNTPLQGDFREGKLSVQEAIYGHVGWIFAQHFLNRLGSEYSSLSSLLDSEDTNHNEILLNLKKRLRSDTFTPQYILQVLRQYPHLIKLCYVDFAMVHYINTGNALGPSLSYQRLQATPVLTKSELLDTIRKSTANTQEFQIFESLATFNKHILKTNFYQPTKTALSFRLDPKFLPATEYPQPLFGMFFVVGSEFRGFHLRFRDIARGGIRVITSRNKETYSTNLRGLFDENYALASTQQRKNKDIPEGGSKGTILLDPSHQNQSRVAFEKYVDAVLDLVVVGQTPGVKDVIVDLYGRQEILFFGPDEGTAGFMDWAAKHARHRGASFWKAFTTGKSQELGGIPHDLYGMTTRSVHQYILGIYEKMGVDEGKVTKVQTGGPDGDLGSNEIKISGDMTIAVVDGSGVLYDPIGIDRAELRRLADARKTISEFNVAKLSVDGFHILIDENNVKLPNGTLVGSGFKFRNEFHLNPLASADIFVPCGGRPESVDITNVIKLFKDDGTPKFRYIVEGANLFLTQEARLKLEEAGVILFKDASANKGGVTSSSLEVLAALAFTDIEFDENMTVKNGVVPNFYADYVASVQQFIETTARLEFESLWREGRRTGTPRSVLSDTLSESIVKLNEELQSTTLWENAALRRSVLSEALPKVLLDKLGMDTLLARIPEAYVKAIFGSYLASRFVYKYGANPSQFAFFEFLAPYFDKLRRISH
ncbi:NAD-dependent glutamate dehydrogenase [Rhizoclosmatium globosum]|uniref:NAD-specific glutamate dehydrogenase n=1 Tax=Rhizoclosmatium globosum TaxID=329046 RepID=A0A1Y2CDF3_9FUNG|nr:NAD-dependent glutamate dehydrogenase [Rhizoclosmatium globosum]|eukprot:ORY45063.1 NAD-dependent glutamate dehydrogenase [Rhizoclosmatium globosum]